VHPRHEITPQTYAIRSTHPLPGAGALQAQTFTIETVAPAADPVAVMRRDEFDKVVEAQWIGVGGGEICDNNMRLVETQSLT